MTITIGHSKPGRAGFSLVEMIVVTAILSLFVAMSMSSVISLSRHATSMVNYRDMNEQSRLMLEQFARDVRGAVEVNEVSETVLSVNTMTSDGSIQLVEYEYYEPAGILYRQVDNGPREITLQDITAIDLNYFTFRNELTMNPIETKRVQIEVILERQVLSAVNTNHIISAQFVLRNHQVSQ